MKKPLFSVRMHNVTGPGQTIEAEVEVKQYDDVQEALIDLGSESVLDIINKYLVQRARVKWREDKYNEFTGRGKKK